MEVDTGHNLSADIEHQPYDQKWEILKPELEILFIYLDLHYADIARFMTRKYAFDAHIPQYKYRFRKWKWRRNVSSSMKEQILDRALQHTRVGKRPSFAIDIEGVEPRKLRRHAMTSQHHLDKFWAPQRCESAWVGASDLFLPFGVRPFSTSNVLVSALRRQSLASPPLSPLSPAVVSNDTTSSMDRLISPATAKSHGQETYRVSSSASQVLVSYACTKSTNLFLQGRFDDLIQSLDSSQIRIMAQWFRDFWMLAFQQAKYWKSDPLRSRQFEPGTFAASRIADERPSQPIEIPFSLVESSNTYRLQTNIQFPTELCKTDVHSSDYEPEGTTFSTTKISLDFQLGQILEQNTTNYINYDGLPIDPSQIASALSKSRGMLLEETLAFAIMASNLRILKSLARFYSWKRLNRALININAAHIATSYINANKECCNILDWITFRLSYEYRFSCVNDHGHTVLDNIMITILKSHSTSSIRNVDQSLRHGAEYVGVEIDICGRWDADSDLCRSLLAAGGSSIPALWKHKFCHTSVQTICHCVCRCVLHQIHYRRFRPQDRSGLFQRLCTICGARLRPRVLHTLVLTGYALANHARPGEDLFGIIACLLCMLSCGLDPWATADISISSLLSNDVVTDVCDHQEMTADELMRNIKTATMDSWSQELKIGWNLLLHVLKRAKTSHMDWTERKEHHSTFHHTEDKDYDAGDTSTTAKSGDEFLREKIDELSEAGSDRYKDGLGPSEEMARLAFGGDLALSRLWTLVQAECLNHKRLTEHDPWLSSNFDMSTILANMESGRLPDTIPTSQRLYSKSYEAFQRGP